jgi:hypothetical protein
VVRSPEAKPLRPNAGVDPIFETTLRCSPGVTKWRRFEVACTGNRIWERRQTFIIHAVGVQGRGLFQSLLAMSGAVGSASGPAKTLTKSDGEQVRKIYSKLATHDNAILDLDKVFKLVFELKDLPHFSPLQILGYFAVLESVLTHAPNPDDRYDSITRQMYNHIKWETAADLRRQLGDRIRGTIPGAKLI